MADSLDSSTVSEYNLRVVLIGLEIIAQVTQYLSALRDLSLANVETSLSTLDLCRSRISTHLPLPLLQPGIALRVASPHNLFCLSAKPDYFVAAEDWTKFDQNDLHNSDEHFGDVIQRLEYSYIDNESNGSNDKLPQYVFQLGRVMVPASSSYNTHALKLPFVAVVDILDPQKAVWLVHVQNIAEDPEEEKDWYPPLYILDRFKYLFDNPNQRKPAYHLAQIAPSLESWIALDYDTMIKNIGGTCRRGTVRIKLAMKDAFKSAVQAARLRASLRISHPPSAHETSSGERSSTPSDRTLDIVR